MQQVLLEQEEKLTCGNCGELLTEDNEVYSEEQKVHICTECEDNDLQEPCLTILTNDQSLDTLGYGLERGDLNMVLVGHYTNGTGDVFKAKWIKTDAWRGYYEVIASKAWKKLHTDCVLAYSEDAEELQQFDDELEDYFKEKGVRFAKVFSRTSNLFSSGYDLFVNRKDFKTAQDVETVLTVVRKLRKSYRDQERFTMTAITGTSKKTKEGKLLVKAYGLAQDGWDFEDIKRELIGG